MEEAFGIEPHQDFELLQRTTPALEPEETPPVSAQAPKRDHQGRSDAGASLDARTLFRSSAAEIDAEEIGNAAETIMQEKTSPRTFFTVRALQQGGCRVMRRG